MHKFLTCDGYLLEKNKLTLSEIVKIKKDLVVSPIQMQMQQLQFVKVPKFTLYRESPNYFILPPYYGYENFGKPNKNYRSIGEKMEKNLIFTYSLLKHQENATEKTYETLITYNGGILCLPCGFGKTGISIYLSLKLGRKTAIIVNKEFLADQWKDAINKFTNNKAKIGRIQGDIYDIKDKDFVICMVQTFCQRTFLHDDMNTFGFFILDECHHMGSEMFSKSLPKIRSKYILGLSATPVRKDGLTKVFEYYTGKICYSEQRTNLNTVNIKKLMLSSDSEEYETLYMSNGLKNTSGMITALTKSINRNNFLIETISILMKEDRKILVLSDRREHLEQLYNLLDQKKIKNIKGEYATYGYYMGNAGKNKKNHKLVLTNSSKCDIILGTFHISSEGLDIPELNTEILTTSHVDVQQSVGRILRKPHDITPLVIDIVDNCGNFTKQSYSRNKFYKNEKYIINSIKINIDNNIDYNELSNFILEKEENNHSEEEIDEIINEPETELEPESICFI